MSVSKTGAMSSTSPLISVWKTRVKVYCNRNTADSLSQMDIVKERERERERERGRVGGMVGGETGFQEHRLAPHRVCARVSSYSAHC